MPRTCSASPPQVHLGVGGEHTPVNESGGGGSGSSGGGSEGLVIHHVTKEINSSGTFPTFTKTNYHDWVVLMWVML
jgi:hypothetical protein